jgi:hyaluronan synthase
LTLFAHLEGRTVQQSSSFAFTVQPSSVSHHLRQQLRWMRGSTIRSVWRFRYLPIRGFAYWEHLVSWVNFILITTVFAIIFVITPLFGGLHITLLMLLLSLLVCYTVGLKYLTVARDDQGLGFQICTLLLAPIILVWTAVVLRPLRIFAILTCYRTGWGTRSNVEVTI